MPRLENWSIQDGTNHNWRQTPDPYLAPELITKHLNGEIYGDHRFHNGDVVTTSTIIGKRDGCVLTRSGTLYQLGKPGEYYSQEFTNAEERLLNSLEEK